MHTRRYIRTPLWGCSDQSLASSLCTTCTACVHLPGHEGWRLDELQHKRFKNKLESGILQYPTDGESTQILDVVLALSKAALEAVEVPGRELSEPERCKQVSSDVRKLEIEKPGAQERRAGCS